MSKKGPSLLLCNDDGIHAPGISALHRAVKDLGVTRVVAPDSERSACGHGITLTSPLRSVPVEMDGVHFGDAIDGTPVDCVKLAVREFMRDCPPDLVLSGINLGSNIGISVLYSGTVSVAKEAVVLGIPGVAFSLCTVDDPEWDMAGRVARELTEKIIEHPIPAGVMLNINLPNLPYEKLNGFKITQMGRSRFIERFVRQIDHEGNESYLLGGELEVQDDRDDIDVYAVRDGYVSITPIHLDYTAYEHLEEMKLFESVF